MLVRWWQGGDWLNGVLRNFTVNLFTKKPPKFLYNIFSVFFFIRTHISRMAYTILDLGSET